MKKLSSMSISLHEKSRKERVSRQWKSMCAIMAGICRARRGPDKRKVLTAAELPKLGGSEVDGMRLLSDNKE